MVGGGCLCVCNVPFLQNFVASWLLNIPTSCSVYLREGFVSKDQLQCCHTKTKVADQASYPTQSQYTNTRLSSCSTDQCCHTEVEVADQANHLTQSQYTYARLSSCSTDQCCHTEIEVADQANHLTQSQ